MKYIMPLTLFIFFFAFSADAAVLVFLPNGEYVSKTSIYDANIAADAVGKTIIVTSPQTLTSNINLAIDRAWKFEKGGILNTNGFTFNVNHAPFEAGLYKIFTSGDVSGLDLSYPQWFGADDTGMSYSTGAVNSAVKSVENGQVRFDGTFTISSTINCKSNVDFVGTGIIQLEIGKGLYSASDIAVITVEDQGHIKIEGLTITGANKSYSFDSSHGTAIFVNNSNDITIQNCKLSNANSGVRLFKSSRCNIVNNYITGNIAQDGIQVLSFDTTNADHNILSNNIIILDSNSTSMGIRISGVPKYPARFNTVTGNTISNAGLEALVLEYADYNTFSNNSIDKSAFGLAIYSGNKNVFTSHSFTDCTSAGIYIVPTHDNCDNNEILGAVLQNTGSKSGNHAIYISILGGKSAKNNTLSDVKVFGANLNGIYVNEPNNRLVNCEIRDTGNNAINVTANGQGTNVIGSKIFNSGGHGIYNAGAHNLFIQGNVFENTNSTGMSAIFMGGGDYHTIVGNYIGSWWRGVTITTNTNVVGTNQYYNIGSGGNITGGYEFTMPNGDMQLLTAGKGVIVKTPDGSKSFRIRVNNNGVLTTDLL